MGFSHDNRYYHDIKAVTTASEVSFLWKCHVNSVYHWLEEGKIYGAKVHGTWIVSLSSAVEFLGKPIEEINRISEF